MFARGDSSCSGPSEKTGTPSVNSGSLIFKIVPHREFVMSSMWFQACVAFPAMALTLSFHF